MRAFVKVNNGCFPNLNFYLAWEAFNQMGYSVTLFEEKDIPNLDISVDTPVFAGITVFKKIMDKLKINYPPFNCYPEVLNPYYGRNLYKSTLGIERCKFNKNNKPVFVKPVLPKQFIGQVWNSILQLIPISNIPDEAEVWVCEPIDIVSEFRVYVHDGEILGVKHYFGDWSVTPNKNDIENVVKEYKPSPISYGIDFAVIRNWSNHVPGLYGKGPVNDTIVLEVNDGCNLGNYGIDSIHYGEMIVSRWFEIVAGHNLNEKIKEQVERENELRNNPYWTSTCGLYNNIDKPLIEGSKRTFRDSLMKDELLKAKQDSMKQFAESVIKEINKGNKEL